MDPRYRFKTSTIIELLDITQEEMRAFDLRTLIDGEWKQERGAIRARQYRERKGATSHERARQERLDVGRKAIDLASSGLSQRAIATQLGRSRQYIQQAIEEAKNAPPPKQGRTVPPIEKQQKTAPSGGGCDSSRCMGGFSPPESLPREGKGHGGSTSPTAPPAPAPDRSGAEGVVVDGIRIPAFLIQ